MFNHPSVYHLSSDTIRGVPAVGRAQWEALEIGHRAIQSGCLPSHSSQASRTDKETDGYNSVCEVLWCPAPGQAAGVQIAASPAETSGQLHALSVPHPHGHVGTVLVPTSKASLRVR